MKQVRPNVSERTAGMLGALAEPMRLRLLRVLEASELSVGEIAKVVQSPQSTVSRHLKVLAEAGWVHRRAEGTSTLFCVVADDLSAGHRGVWSAVRDESGSATERAEDLRRLRAVLSERRVDSQSFFARHAADWEGVREELFGARFTSVALLGLLRRDWVVADVGCGTGNVSELVSPHVERVIALDASEAMLESARRRLAGQGNVTFVRGEASRTGLAGASVDVAVCVLVLHHVAEPGGVLAEMARVLRRSRGSGVAIVVDMVAHDREEYRRRMGHQHLGFSRETMDVLAREAGLVDGVYRELPAEASAKGPGLFAMTARVAE